MPKEKNVTKVEDTPISDSKMPDIFSDELPAAEINYLDDEVKKKPYTKIDDAPPAPAGSNGVEPAIVSADETKPTAATKGEFESTPPPSSSTIATADGGLGVSPPPEITTEEAQSNAEQTVKFALKFYDKLHTIGRWVGKIDDEDLTSMHLRGKINLNREFPLKGDTITAGEFFATVNNQIDESIQVSDKLKDEITPPLVRECVKRGWLLGDLLYVGAVVFDDISTKLGILIGLKKNSKDILNALLTEQQNKKKEVESKLDDIPDDDKWGNTDEGDDGDDNKEEEPPLEPEEIIQ